MYHRIEVYINCNFTFDDKKEEKHFSFVIFENNLHLFARSQIFIQSRKLYILQFFHFYDHLNSRRIFLLINKEMTSSENTKLTKYYNQFCDYMQKDTKGVEIGIYTISGIIFSVAYYRIRPFTKFGKPSDIPKIFIRDKIRQYGTIKAVDPSSSSGPLLLINHKPPLYFLVPSKKLIPVKLTGITLNANGYSWLQTVSLEHDVEFIPIIRNSDNAECQVFMKCPKNRKDPLDLSEALLSLGFGKFSKPPSMTVLKDPDWKKYYKFLSQVEGDAKNDRLGLWSQSLPPKPWLIRKAKDVLKSAILSILPADRRLPELVR